MNQIQLITAPVIKHDLYAVGASVTERIKALNIEGQVATEDTVSSLKKLRTELNKELAEFEAQRKAIKEAVTTPYNELEAVYKSEVSDKYKNATEMLKDKIAEVEDRIKANTLAEIQSYFNELCVAEGIDFLQWNHLGIEVKLSDSMKSYKDRITAFVSKVVDELSLIDTQNHKAEILVEYKKTLNAAKAIKYVQDRKEAERLEAERLKFAEINRRTAVLRIIPMIYRDITRTYEYDNDIYITEDFLNNSTKDVFQSKIAEVQELVKLKKAAEAKPEEPIKPLGQIIKDAEAKKAAEAPLQAPVIETKEEIVSASFEVTGTMTQLRALGEFLKSNNYNYKNI